MDDEVADSLLVIVNSKLKKTGYLVGFGYHNLLIIIFLPLLLELPLGNGRKLSLQILCSQWILQSLASEISFNRLQLIASFGRSWYPVSPRGERRSNDTVVPEVTPARRTQHRVRS